jgi:hypothetical protein
MSEKDRLQIEESAELARTLCQQAAQLYQQADHRGRSVTCHSPAGEPHMLAAGP